MITRTYLPDSIALPTGETLMPVIGGHLKQKPFLTDPDCTKPNWGNELLDKDPCYDRAERKAIIAEAKRRGLKYRNVGVLSRNLRGKLDLHNQPYRPSRWVFVEVTGTI